MRQQNCEAWWEFKKCWRNNNSPRQERRNIKWIKTSIIKIEYHKISSTVSKFLTKTWIEVNGLLRGQCSVNKNKGFNNCWGRYNAKPIDEKLIFKNNISFRLCILKISNIFIGNAEDLDIVLTMSDLLS